MFKLRSQSGFTLIEVMTVVVVMAVILSSVIGLTADKTPREDLEAKARQAVDTISRAHNYALNGYHGDDWGIRVLDGSADCVEPGTADCIILFKGRDYETRDSNYDEIMVFDTGAYLDSNQSNEYYFKQSSGWLASTTAISDQALIIKNDFNSFKTVTTTITGLIYFEN